MTLRQEFSLGNSEFNEFLFAIVGEENNGMQLTVLSALARLGMDPWGEAARLARLPKEAASRALASVIATLPEGNWKVSEARTIANRLVDRLPRGSASAAQPPAERDNGGLKTKSVKLSWLIGVLVVAALLFFWSRMDTDHPSAPPAAPGSTMQR